MADWSQAKNMQHSLLSQAAFYCSIHLGQQHWGIHLLQLFGSSSILRSQLLAMTTPEQSFITTYSNVGSTQTEKFTHIF